MRRGLSRLTAALAVAVAFSGAATALAASHSIFVDVGSLRISFAATIEPQRLPRSKLASARVRLSSRFTTSDGSHVPPMTRATVGIDRSVGVDPAGIPVCSAGQLEGQTSEGAEAACPGAIVAAGTTRVEVALPGGPPIDAESRLLAFNGGVAAGVATLYLHAYLSSPVVQSIVVPVTLTRIRRGEIGTRAALTVPRIASGAGSIAGFELAFKRRLRTAAGSHGYLEARCGDGNFLFEPSVELEDGDLARGTLAFGCSTKG
jgi:hypothetical protein